jgi:DNA-binding NarL/FixJ family response regulator
VHDTQGAPLVTIMLCDHNLLIRGGLRKVLEEEPDIVVVAEVDDGAQAAEAAQRLRPDIVFIELAMPRMYGLQTARKLTRASTEPIGVVFLAEVFDVAHAIEGLLAGGRAFLTKNDPPEHLVAVARAVAAGFTLLSPEVAARLEPWVTHPRTVSGS